MWALASTTTMRPAASVDFLRYHGIFFLFFTVRLYLDKMVMLETK